MNFSKYFKNYNKTIYELLNNVKEGSIMLEEFARTQIAAEEMHEAELKKMLRDNF